MKRALLIIALLLMAACQTQTAMDPNKAAADQFVAEKYPARPAICPGCSPFTYELQRDKASVFIQVYAASGQVVAATIAEGKPEAS